METRTEEATEVLRAQQKDSPMVAQQQPSTPAAMIAAALRGSFDVDELERLYELQRQYDKDEARKSFNMAVAAFKRNPPDIVRDMLNKQYGSTYASIAAVVNTTNKALAPHGLNASWSVVDQSKDGMKIACILSHAQGHSERVELWGPMDTSGQKNPLQQVRSTTTYLRIATFEMVTGVASRVGNSDDDGNTAGETDEQRAKREAAEKKEAEWVAKIQGATSMSAYEGLRVDLIAEYGGSGNKVPKPLRDFCLEKKAALNAQEAPK